MSWFERVRGISFSVFLGVVANDGGGDDGRDGGVNGDEPKLKLLPLVMSWFERVSTQQAEISESARFRGILVESVSTEEIQKRQLSTMYKFVRSMPLEAINGYRHYSSHKKRKFDLLGRNFHTLVLLCFLTLVLPLL